MNPLRPLAALLLLLMVLIACGPGEAPPGDAGTDRDDPQPPISDDGCPAPSPEHPVTLRLADAYAIQVTQNASREVPLVIGKDSVVQVLVEAEGLSERGLELPLEVELALGNGLESTIVLAGGAACLSATSAADTQVLTLAASLPADWLEAGTLRLAATLKDPELPGVTVEEPRHPSAGHLALEAVPTAPLRITVVPIVMSRPPPDLDEETVREHLEYTLATFPLSQVHVTIRSPYTFTPPAGSGDISAAALAALARVRVMDGSKDLYLGLLEPSSRFVPSGLAYIGSPVAIVAGGTGFGEGDLLGETIAHEIGHTLGLRHAPCGPPGMPDVDHDYPHRLGSIGAEGLDIRTRKPIPSTHKDLMSYCAPAWISDWNYLKLLSELAVVSAAQGSTGPVDTARPTGPAPEVLVVSGAIGPSGVRLDPTFVLAGVTVPPSSGPYVIDLLDGDGHAVASAGFDVSRVAQGHAPEPVDAAHFAVAIPLPMATRDEVAGYAIRGADGALLTHGAFGSGLHAAASGAPMAAAATAGDGLTRITWDTSRYSGALAIDADTNLAIGHDYGGVFTVPYGNGTLHLLLCDGVRCDRSVLDVGGPVP